MITIHVLRILSYLLAIMLLIAGWWYLPEQFNSVLEFAENLVRVAARKIAVWMDKSPFIAETIALDKAHMDRTLVVGLLMIGIFFVLLRLSLITASLHVFRVAMLILVAHLAILIAWIGFTDVTAGWYGMHAQWMKNLLRANNYHHAETMLIKVLHVHTIPVLIEVMVALSVCAALVANLLGLRVRR